MDLANEELGRKELALRDYRRKSEIYQGENLEKRSRAELQQAQKQLADVLQIVNQILSGSNGPDHHHGHHNQH